MKKNLLLYLTFTLLVVIGVLHLAAQVFYFYWTLWWFDLVMHFLSGFAVGLFAIWLFFHSNYFFRQRAGKLEAVLIGFGSVMVIGICWEIFEYINDIAVATEGYVLDTFRDLLSNVIGALLGSFVASQENEPT